MLFQPINGRLQNAKQVLIAGAGGGFDVVCGLPLFFALERIGCSVHLASLSFTKFSETTGVRQQTQGLYEVTSQAQGAGYFPEKHLADWFRLRLQRNLSIWGFDVTGVQPYMGYYKFLIEHLHLDTIILVDGGVDALLRGDEHSLGTPLWDALSVIAVDEVAQVAKVQTLLASVAFGAERWDKISHAQALRRIAEYTASEAFLGVSSLLPQTQEGKLFVDASRYIFAQQPTLRPSTVVCSMLAALRGDFGEMPLNEFTQETPLWISPLMNLFWFFELSLVAKQKLYRKELRNTETLGQAAEVLKQFTDLQKPASWEAIPI